MSTSFNESNRKLYEAATRARARAAGQPPTDRNAEFADGADKVTEGAWSSKSEGYSSCGSSSRHSAHEHSGGENYCEGNM